MPPARRWKAEVKVGMVAWVGGTAGASPKSSICRGREEVSNQAGPAECTLLNEEMQKADDGLWKLTWLMLEPLTQVCCKVQRPGSRPHLESGEGPAARRACDEVVAPYTHALRMLPSRS